MSRYSSGSVGRFMNTVLGRPARLFCENSEATLNAAIDLNSPSTPDFEGAMAVVAQGIWRGEAKCTGRECQGSVCAKHLVSI